jgi:hypothetical protein
MIVLKCKYKLNVEKVFLNSERLDSNNHGVPIV